MCFLSPRASPASSSIGYPQEEKKAIYSGEKLLLRPQLRDQFGNPAAAPPDSLTALLESPDGPQPISVKPSTKGLGAYEVTCESALKGEYTLHVRLFDMPIGGSPGVFFVHPAVPTAVRSRLLPPTEATVTHQNCELVLVAVDKLGNTLDRGGARVDARVLGPNASQCTVEDRRDGTYTITFTAGAVGEYRVIARLDNVEMSPLPLQFVEGTRFASSEAKETATTDSRAESKAKARQPVVTGRSTTPYASVGAAAAGAAAAGAHSTPVEESSMDMDSRVAADGVSAQRDPATLPAEAIEAGATYAPTSGEHEHEAVSEAATKPAKKSSQKVERHPKPKQSDRPAPSSPTMAPGKAKQGKASPKTGRGR